MLKLGLGGDWDSFDLSWNMWFLGGLRLAIDQAWTHTFLAMMIHHRRVAVQELRGTWT